MVGAQRTETFDVTALLNSKGVPLNEIVGLAKDGKLAFTIIVPK